jgi:hypothetical protein
MRWTTIVGLAMVVSVAGAQETRSADAPPWGVYYDRREPSFYTGFAPRTLDPARIHLHVGRGNQLRVTVVLSDEVLAEYARDLDQRRRTYRALIDAGRLVLTQNRAVEDFEARLREVNLDALVAAEPSLPPDALRARNLDLLERLNPGRVFRIRMPLDGVLRRWMAIVQEDGPRLDDARRLELVNAMLPNRLWVTELTPRLAGAVDALVARVAAGATLAELRAPFLALLTRVSGDRYPVCGDTLTFDEFTAIYPVGTLNEYTTWNGRRIPEFPTPGRRALTTHQRTLTIDHIPTDESFSYSPWLPYIHIGPRMHDALHTLWWQMEPARTGFLPATWRSVDGGSRDGHPFRYLWLLSRGPMSHGCTHVNTGHIAELRQLLPSEATELAAVDVYYNQSPLYDVFDIDGDGTPEVMGVEYFVAYDLRGNQPGALRAPIERHGYYEWLYAGDLGYDSGDRGVFHNVRDARFVGRSALPGRTYERIALDEAAYEPERVQFYRLIDIPFARELRKVGVHTAFPGLALASGGAQ